MLAFVVVVVVADAAAAPPPVDELDRICLQNIARFKRPKDYRFVEALPTNGYGKVLERELREMLAAEAPERDRTNRDRPSNPATAQEGRPS